MAIDLRKSSTGSTISRVAVEATADVGSGTLNLVAMLLGGDGQPVDDRSIVFRERPRSTNGAMRFVGGVANASGPSGESVEIELLRLPSAATKVVLCVALDGRENGLDPQWSARASVRVYDLAEGVEISRSSPELGLAALTREVGRLVRIAGDWRFIESSRSHRDGLDALRRRYAAGPRDEAAARHQRPSFVEPIASPEAIFIEMVSRQGPSRYCGSSEREALIGAGVRGGLDRSSAETVLDLELERLGIANEAALLVRLEALLRRFTDKDRRLDDKERRDAVQLVCRAAAGFAEGMRHDVADDYVVRFCRERGVKVKVGLLKWAVP